MILAYRLLAMLAFVSGVVPMLVAWRTFGSTGSLVALAFGLPLLIAGLHLWWLAHMARRADEAVDLLDALADRLEAFEPPRRA